MCDVIETVYSLLVLLLSMNGQGLTTMQTIQNGTTIQTVQNIFMTLLQILTALLQHTLRR